MKSYTDLNLVIVDKLKALVDSEDETIFVDVYSVPETKPAGYPCAFVFERGGEGSILDTERNEREWQFEVSLMQEASRRTPEEAMVIMRDIVDRVIEMFDQDPQLTVDDEDQCMRVRIVPLSFDFVIREQPAAFARFVVACVDTVRNYP